MLFTWLYVSDASDWVTRSLTYHGSQICSCQTQGGFFYFLFYWERGGVKDLTIPNEIPATYLCYEAFVQEQRICITIHSLSTCSLHLLLVSLTDSILSHKSIKLSTPCNGCQATFPVQCCHTTQLPRHAKYASDTYFAFRLHQAHWVDYKDDTCRFRLRRDKTSSRKMDPLKQLKCLVKHVWTCASTCCAKQRLPH